MKNIIHNPEQEHNLKQVKNHKSQPQITNSSQVTIVLKREVPLEEIEETRLQSRRC